MKKLAFRYESEIVLAGFLTSSIAPPCDWNTNKNKHIG
jgi:hypothetical protein